MTTTRQQQKDQEQGEAKSSDGTGTTPPAPPTSGSDAPKGTSGQGKGAEKSDPSITYATDEEIGTSTLKKKPYFPYPDPSKSRGVSWGAGLGNIAKGLSSTSPTIKKITTMRWRKQGNVCARRDDSD